MSDAVVQVGPIEKTASGKSIIRAILGGTLRDDDVMLLKGWADGLKSTIKNLSSGEHSVCVLLDISKFGTYTNPSIITVLASLMKDDEKFVYRTATWGGNLIHEMTENVVSTIAGRHNLKNFKTEKEALDWLEG